MFALSESRLNPEKLKQDLETPRAGALVTFEGWVRNHNDGREVLRLDYEAYEPLAEKEGQRIIEEALSRFEIEKAVCIHRTGRLVIGEPAVWVGVSSAHRDAAFAAARYIIDEIKTRLPIWKKEHYKNGEAVWVNCQQCAGAHSHTELKQTMQAQDEKFAGHTPPAQNLRVAKESTVEIDEAAYYSRQLVLPEVGPEGQEKLKKAKVLVVGAGGLGSAALPYLAGAGIGTLGICEPDQLEASNLHRQVLYSTEGINQSKAALAARQLKALNPTIHIQTYPEALDTNNSHAILAGYDLVLDCTDNFETRFLLNDAALQLQKPLIQASIYQYEGQIHLLNPKKGACLRCQWPDATDSRLVGSCREAGVIGAVAGVLGSLQAMEVIKFLLGLPSPLDQSLLIVDLLSLQNRLIKRKKNPTCSACGNGIMQSLHVDELISDKTWELVFDQPEALSGYVLVDVGEANEHEPIDGFSCLHLPFSNFDLENPPLDREKNYLLYCRKGIRSSHLARTLREAGWMNLFALAGGLNRQDLHALQRDRYVGA